MGNRQANKFSCGWNFLNGRLSKAFATAVFIICTSPYAKGQVLVGPLAGAKMGWISYFDKEYRELFKSSPQFGFHAGGSVSLRMKKRVFLQTSILYAQRNKTVTARYDKSLRNKVQYNYLDVPILFTKEFKMRFGKGKYYNLYFGAGPSLNYWLGGKGELKSDDLVENFINPPNYTLPYTVTFQRDPESIPLGHLNVSDANRLQLGLIFSAGIVFEPVGVQKFMVTAQYELGHSFFSQDTDGDFGSSGQIYYFDEMQARNKALSLSLFYFIDLKTEDRNKGKSTIKIDKIKKGRRR